MTFLTPSKKSVNEIPAGCANRSLEDVFRTAEGAFLYQLHPKTPSVHQKGLSCTDRTLHSHFVHQKSLSCTKVKGLVVDDE